MTVMGADSFPMNGLTPLLDFSGYSGAVTSIPGWKSTKIFSTSGSMTVTNGVAISSGGVCDNVWPMNVADVEIWMKYSIRGGSPGTVSPLSKTYVAARIINDNTTTPTFLRCFIDSSFNFGFEYVFAGQATAFTGGGPNNLAEGGYFGFRLRGTQVQTYFNKASGGTAGWSSFSLNGLNASIPLSGAIGIGCIDASCAGVMAFGGGVMINYNDPVYSRSNRGISFG